MVLTILCAQESVLEVKLVYMQVQIILLQKILQFVKQLYIWEL
jgi:hypothetical protein